jgi:ubiquinol-cytochrome c reductase cytochrome c subunit
MSERETSPSSEERAFVDEDFDPFDAADGALGFEPVTPVTGAEPADAEPAAAGPGRTRRRGRARRPASWRRRIGAGAVLVVGLLGTGGVYSAFADTSSGSSSANEAAAGQQLYETSCITCHGANLQGVKDRAPSLIGVGGASVYFQVSTGRMPATGQYAEETRKTAKFTEQQAEQLAAYVESVGGGPKVPEGNLRSADIGQGGELFRLNCASCHGATGKGAPLSAGKSAPSLMNSTDKEIYTAMLSGPESMPIFSDNQLTPTEKREIIGYLQTIKASADPGGEGIGRIGPVSEAVVIWVAGIGALMVVILWIGAKVE